MPVPALYDSIGAGYSGRRGPDPRIAQAIMGALGGAGSVVNVGAGTGSYEPSDRRVVAVEPSAVMISQRPNGSAPAVMARAENLPFSDKSFSAVLAVLSAHHWTDQRRGLSECARVARERVVIFTWDPASEFFWMVQEYFPEILDLDRKIFPRMEMIEEVLGPIRVMPVPIPGDCADGFLGAYWRRPEAYLQPEVRGGMSSFKLISNAEAGLQRLHSDLQNGKWDEQYGHLRNMWELDMGYRLVTAEIGE